MSIVSKTYVCSYRYKGAEYGVDIPATSFDDARARLTAIGNNGCVDGILKFKFKLHSGLSTLLAKFMNWLGW